MFCGTYWANGGHSGGHGRRAQSTHGLLAQGTKDRSAAGYGSEKKMDGISRLSRGFGVPGAISTHHRSVALRFASAGAFWRVLNFW